ncbi:hypothetical protein MSIM_36350 [Mycobacterium simiae]|nr:hypothetical protein MSIM_36350 [Mycobacterium simiae]
MARAAAPDIHATYGPKADAMVSELGPSHRPVVNPAINERYPAAAVCSSAANPSQAIAAMTIDAGPGPAYIRAELISGGKAPKSIT